MPISLNSSEIVKPIVCLSTTNDTMMRNKLTIRRSAATIIDIMYVVLIVSLSTLRMIPPCSPIVDSTADVSVVFM